MSERRPLKGAKRSLLPEGCAICAVRGKPDHVAFEIGFVAGFAYALAPKSNVAKDFVDKLCEPHAIQMVRVLANRVPK